MNILQRLWNDEAGFVVSTEMTMVASVVVLGLTAGAVAVRDQVVQELSDTAQAIASFDQSFSYSAITGCNSSSAGVSFQDARDFGDEEDQNAVGFPSACAAVNQPADEELPNEI